MIWREGFPSVGLGYILHEDWRVIYHIGKGGGVKHMHDLFYDGFSIAWHA